MAELMEDFTFDDLTSLYRVEKASGTLSPVRKDLYTAMNRLLENIDREREKQLMSDFDSVISEGLIGKYQKTELYVKRVIEVRMNKIAALAMRSSMGSVATTDHLPPEEREYYNKILECSKGHWDIINRKKKKAYIPDIVEEIQTEQTVEVIKEPVVSKIEPVEELSLEEIPYIPDEPIIEEEPEIFDDEPILEEEIGEIIEETPIEEPVSSIDDVYIDDEKCIVIMILESMPPFSGPDMDYNLRKGDVVKMPIMMADVLISRNMAKKINA